MVVILFLLDKYKLFVAAVNKHFLSKLLYLSSQFLLDLEYSNIFQPLKILTSI